MSVTFSFKQALNRRRMIKSTRLVKGKAGQAGTASVMSLWSRLQ